MIISYLNTPAYDYLTATLIEGLIELGHTVYTSELSNYGLRLKRKDFIAEANKSDLLIIGSNRNVKYNYLNYIKNSKTVFVDGSDSSYLNFNFEYPVNLIFKREYLSHVNYSNQTVIPLQFAAEKRYFSKDFVAKDIDISFLAANNNFLREAINNILSSKYKLNSITQHTGEISYSGASGNPFENPKYFNILSRSKIVVNIPGRGWDCGRFWEAISNKALVITYKLDIVMPNPFIEGKHILCFNSLDDFIAKIEYCLSNPIDVRNMANEAYKHLIEFHTSKKRAEYFLKQIEFHYDSNTIINTKINRENKTSNSNLWHKIRHRLNFS